MVPGPCGSKTPRRRPADGDRRAVWARRSRVFPGSGRSSWRREQPPSVRNCRFSPSGSFPAGTVSAEPVSAGAAGGGRSSFRSASARWSPWIRQVSPAAAPAPRRTPGASARPVRGHLHLPERHDHPVAAAAPGVGAGRGPPVRGSNRQGRTRSGRCRSMGPGARVIPAALSISSAGPTGTMGSPASAGFARNRWCVVMGCRRRPPPGRSGPEDRPAPPPQPKGTRRRPAAPAKLGASVSRTSSRRRRQRRRRPEGGSPEGEVVRRTGSSN